jgi:pseudaminic acid cytidylyltransferase
LFDEVMVSTDDAEIAEIAIQYGAKVPFYRSQLNSNDFATTADVLIEVLDVYTQSSRHFDYACCLYPTSPLLKLDTLKKAYHRLIKENLDCIFPVVPFSYPVQRSLRLNEQTLIEMREPEFLNTRSQDLEPIYHDAGQFYFFNSDTFRKKKKLWTDNTASIIISELESQDIDNESDWVIAEMKYALSIDS